MTSSARVSAVKCHRLVEMVVVKVGCLAEHMAMVVGGEVCVCVLRCAARGDCRATARHLACRSFYISSSQEKKTLPPPSSTALQWRLRLPAVLAADGRRRRR